MRLEGKSLKGDFIRFIIPSIVAQWVFALYTMVDGCLLYTSPVLRRRGMRSCRYLSSSIRTDIIWM